MRALLILALLALASCKSTTQTPKQSACDASCEQVVNECVLQCKEADKEACELACQNRRDQCVADCNIK